jgi:AcrR family transcriptional regulator
MPAGRKPSFSRDDFTVSALAIADEKGVSALSIRTLAASKGVTSATIYRYFTDKDDLISAVRTKLLSELIEEVSGAGPREQLLALGMAFRSQVRAHPCLVEFIAMPSKDGSMTAVNTFIVDKLRELGLSGGDLVRGFRQLESFVVGVSLFDFSDAPNHLTDRFGRMKNVEDQDFTSRLRTPEDIDTDNEQAFETTFIWLVDMLATTPNSSK